MTDYSFSPTLVWDNLGGSVKVARNARVDVLDPTTGTVAPGLKQSGQPVSWVTSDLSGLAEFTAQLKVVRLALRIGGTLFSYDVISPDAYSEAVTASASAASSATSAAGAATAAANSATSAQNAANLVGSPAASAIDTYLSSGSSVAVRKGDLRINVKDYGATGNGTTDDTTAVRNAVTAAISNARPLWFPNGTYLVDAAILVQNTSDFRLDMEGRLKRKNASTRDSILYFKNVTGLRLGRVRTDGNALNNTFVQSDSVAYPVDEAKHDVRIEGCTDVELDMLDSRNPSGDSLYITGSTTRGTFGRIVSYSAQSSGRNAVSIVSGSNLHFDSVISDGTGCNTGVIAMPGGFDIEPNSGQTVTDVTVSKAWVRTNGTSGIGVFGNYTVGGVRQIKRVKFGEVTLIKTAGVKTASSDVPIKGADDVTIVRLTHSTDAANTNQALSIDDASIVNINIDIPRNGSANPIVIGASATVDLLELRGRIGASGTDCLSIVNLTNSLFDLTLKNPANSKSLVVKQASGTSSNVRFRGDWRFDTTGSLAMNVNGTVTDWLVDGADWTGWGPNLRIRGSGTPSAVDRRNVKGLTYGTAAPNFDFWNAGHYIENTAPTELGTAGSKYVVRGWVCTVAGAPGTWLPVRALTGN